MQAAKELGCLCIVAPPPHYYKHSQEGIEKYFETLAEGVDIPIVIYNIPMLTQPIGYDVIKRLARHPNVVAMKESSGSMVDMLHFMDPEVAFKAA